MIERITPYRWALEPAIALLLLVAVLTTRVSVGVDGVVAAAALCSAVALSRVMPAVALAAAAAGVVVVLSDSGDSTIATAWAAYVGLAIVAFGTAAHGLTVTKWFTFASCIAVGPLGILLALRSGSLTLTPGRPSSGAVVVWAAAAVVTALVLSLGLLAFWLLGFLLSRAETEGRLEPLSLLGWLARPEEVDTGTLASETLVRRLAPRQLGFDLVIAAVLIVFSVLEPQTSVLSIIAALAFTAAIALRRVSPALALGLAWAGAIVQLIAGERVRPENVAILFVLYATAAYGNRTVRWIGLVSAGVGAFVSAFYLTATAGLAQPYYQLISGRIAAFGLQFAFLLVLSAIVLGLSWVLGLLVRTWRIARTSRQAQLAAELQRRVAQESVAVEHERTRIARDMHDVVAHSLAVVIAQADGARYARHDDPEALDAALQTISMTAREALGDVRLLLTELREGESEIEGPQPGIAEIQRLVDQMSGAGLDVAMRHSGSPLPLSQGHQIALYRIIQEALTNALRHGDTSRPVSVTCDWEVTGVTVSILNSRGPTGDPEAAIGGPRIGHGLPGMRERAQLAGGWLSAEPHEDTFAVTAFLPSTPSPSTREAHSP